MTSIKVLVSRLLDLLFSARRERRLDEEIRSHLEMLTEENVAAGLTPEEAARAARRAFGGVEQIKEAYRDQRGLPLIERLTQDTGFALRLMLRNRGFALTAVLVLAVGIGVNNMPFTILNAHTLRGLPIPESERVLWLSTIDDGGASRGLSFPDYQDLAAAAGRPERIAAFESAPMVISGDGRPAERLDGAYVTANAFSVVAATPLPGRDLVSDDDRPGAAVVQRLLMQTAWGFAAGVALTRVWGSMFSSADADIRPTDPMSLARVGVVLAVLVSVAAIVPSRRASHIHPIQVLMNR